jgi:hypothetical protein
MVCGFTAMVNETIAAEYFPSLNRNWEDHTVDELWKAEMEVIKFRE